MYIIGHKDIVNLNISPSIALHWVENALLFKENTNLPPKVSFKLENNIFFNSMPCFIPNIERIGVKLVSRYPLNTPSLSSKILLFDSKYGETLALMDCNWITAMRTGAVTALSIMKLQSRKDGIYAFVGLGNTARATLLCLLNNQKETYHKVRILNYKNQAQDFIKRFSAFDNVNFEIVNSSLDLVNGSDVIISCVTAFDGILAPDEFYKEGVLVVPVHTRGFQNCDLFFDKVYGDDKGHLKDFKYFSQFKYFNEFAEIIKGVDNGRLSSKERILAYNIGIALHDVYFASNIYDSLDKNKLPKICLDELTNKFWI